MIEHLFSIIHSLNIWEALLIGPGISILGIVVNHVSLKNRSKKIIDIFCCVWLFLTIGTGIYERMYIVEVPNLLENSSSYKEAKKIVEENNLEIDPIVEDPNGLYVVVKQSVDPGKFVKKGSVIKVNLVTVGYNDSNYKDAIKEYSLSTTEIAIKLYSLDAKIYNEEGSCAVVLGERIDNLEDIRIEMVRRKDEKLDKPLTISTDYSIIQAYSQITSKAIVFDSIPYGIYDVYINADGYKEDPIEIEVGNNLYSKEHTLYLERIGSSNLAPSRVYFLGEKPKRMNVDEFGVRTSSSEVYSIYNSFVDSYKESVIVHAFSGTNLEFKIVDENGNEYFGHTNIGVAGEDVYLYLDNKSHRAISLSEEEYLRDYFGK